MACDNCGSRDISIVYTIRPKNAGTDKGPYTVSDMAPKKPDTIARCGNCGLTFVPRHNGNYEILNDYESYVDEEYVREEKGRRRAATILLGRIESFSKKGRMLEIGCANGFFLDEARKNGWETVGVEPSRWARKYAEEKMGVAVASPVLEESTFEKESFDVVVMLDVIEHLESPRRTLVIINRILKKGGLLVVTTPDVDSFLSRFLRARWWGINHYHLFYFSKKTIDDIFKRTGFNTLSHKSHIRIFTIRYWLKRISSYLPRLISAGKVSPWIQRLYKQNIRISLYDQIEVYAQKM